ncbi:MAG: hypothetical protein K9G48_08860 [Reyranella sp.]|nr:hypothetical protein [Reyranella sp.]
MTTLKQKAGARLIPGLPFNLWVFRVNRLELNAAAVRMLGRMHPGWIRRRHALRAQSGLLANLGCGPFGLAGWVNLDRFDSPGVTMRVDCRHNLPMAECLRCLEPGGCIDREQHGPYSLYMEARR